MRSRFLKGALAVVAIVATAGLFPVAALAATFDYSLSGGFFFDPALAENALPNPTRGNGSIGGLELNGLVTNPTGLPAGSTAPANTYRHQHRSDEPVRWPERSSAQRASSRHGERRRRPDPTRHTGAASGPLAGTPDWGYGSLRPDSHQRRHHV